MGSGSYCQMGLHHNRGALPKSSLTLFLALSLSLYLSLALSLTISLAARDRSCTVWG